MFASVLDTPLNGVYYSQITNSQTATSVVTPDVTL